MAEVIKNRYEFVVLFDVDVSFHVECKVGQPRPLIDP